MGNSIACFFFTLVVPSFALPFTIRSVINDRDRDVVSSGVVMGIVVGIRMLQLPLIIPHCADILRSGTHHYPPPLVCLQNVYPQEANLNTSLRCTSSNVHQHYS